MRLPGLLSLQMRPLQKLGIGYSLPNLRFTAIHFRMAPSFANANIEYLIFAPDLLGRNETDLSDKSMYKLRQTSLARKGTAVKPIKVYTFRSSLYQTSVYSASS